MSRSDYAVAVTIPGEARSFLTECWPDATAEQVEKRAAFYTDAGYEAEVLSYDEHWRRQHERYEAWQEATAA